MGLTGQAVNNLTKSEASNAVSGVGSCPNASGISFERDSFASRRCSYLDRLEAMDAGPATTVFRANRVSRSAQEETPQ